MLAFVIGTGRCGSTLVYEVLARHPGVGFVSNLEDKLPALDLRGRWNNALLAERPLAIAALARSGTGLS